jgi:ubiquinone/menaquinone biosynthesis C-methylase UbiE
MDDKLFWERYFKTYDILNEAIPYQKLLEDFIRSLNINEGDLILDAGSGTGNLCIRLKACGSKPVGFDFSEKAIKIHLSKDHDAEVYFGDLTHTLAFPNNYFDKIVSNNVLYTINKDIRLDVIKELHRILKPRGKLVIANVHIGFNPFLILLDHLKQSIKLKGIINTIRDLPGKICAIFKIFYYSFVLITRDRKGRYAFMEEDEQRKLLLQAGFRNVHETIKTYSNQSYLDMGIK